MWGAGFGVAGLRLGCRAESSSVFCLTTTSIKRKVASAGIRWCVGPTFGQGSRARGGFRGGSAVKNPPANEGDAGDAGSIPELGRSPGGGKGYPLQYSCLGNPLDGGVWWAAVRVVTKESDTA